MGFIGLDSWSDSDGASDCRCACLQAIAKVFKKELKNKANEWNTPGYINVLLVVMDFNLEPYDGLWTELNEAEKYLSKSIRKTKDPIWKDMLQDLDYRWKKYKEDRLD